MSIRKAKSLAYWVVLLCVAGCAPHIDPSGVDDVYDIDFTRVVAAGDGFVAGYTNAGLFLAAQEHSFPNIFARQVARTYAGSVMLPFKQPLLPQNGSGYYKIGAWSGVNECNKHVNTPLLEKTPPSNGWISPVYMQAPFDNLGIPLLRAAQIAAPDSTANNAYIKRLIPTPTKTSYAEYLLSPVNGSATFFLFWLGTEEVLARAATGRIKATDFASESLLKAQYQLVLDRMLSIAESGGVVAYVPDITAFPLFSAQPDSFYESVTCTPAPIYIRTENGSIRAAQPEDMILLPAVNVLGTTLPSGERYGLSAAAPLAAAQVLDADELAILRSVIASYNAAISSAAAKYKKKLAMVDLNPLLAKLQQKFTVDGVAVSTAYLTGDVFDVDGKYFTPRGNALIANECIRACNEQLGTMIPQANVAEHEGTDYP